MKRVFLAAVFCALAFGAFAADTLAVADLQVSSDNPKYQYMGKGIAELISFELAKSKGVALIERERRTEMVEEMEWSVSDLADEAKQLQIGKLLAAKYMVFGEMIDMDQVVLISLRMVDVETGQVVWRDKMDESLTRYGYIAGYFAKSILKHLNAAVAESTEKAVVEKQDKDVAAAVALSSAIDSYDKKDTAKAKQSLEEAKRLDPKNEVVGLYLQKLSPTGAKYKVQLELFGPSANPAVLGVIRQDRIYGNFSAPLDMSEGEFEEVGDGFGLGEQSMSTRVGVEVPLGQRVGVSVEFASSSFDNKVEAPFTFSLFGDPLSTYFHDRETSFGGVVSVGFRVLDWLSVGAGAHVYYNTVHATDEVVWDRNVELAADVGLLVRAPNNSVVFDVHGIYTTQREYYLDPSDGSGSQVCALDTLPLVFEGTLTTAFLDRKLFLVTKALADLYYGDRQGMVLRGIPVVEFWPFRFVSIRGGYQFTYLGIDGRVDTGHGFVVGTTVRIGKFDFDFNYTNRYQPGRVLPGYGKRESFLLLSVSKSDTFSALSR